MGGTVRFILHGVLLCILDILPGDITTLHSGGIMVLDMHPFIHVLHIILILTGAITGITVITDRFTDEA